jgi:hypothetical protein
MINTGEVTSFSELCGYKHAKRGMNNETADSSGTSAATRVSTPCLISEDNSRKCHRHEHHTSQEGDSLWDIESVRSPTVALSTPERLLSWRNLTCVSVAMPWYCALPLCSQHVRIISTESPRSRSERSETGYDPLLPLSILTAAADNRPLSLQEQTCTRMRYRQGYRHGLCAAFL